MTPRSRAIGGYGSYHKYGAREMPLGMLPEGAQASIVRIFGGRGLTRRLAELGFNPGVLVRVVRNHNPGPMLVEVKDTKIALGRGVALKIMVEEVG